MGSPPRPPKKGRGLKKTLIIVGSVIGGLIVLVVVIGVITLLVDHSHAKHAAAHTTLETPATLAGMVRIDDDATLTKVTDQLKEEIKSNGDIRSATAAYYADENGGVPHVAIWGGVGVIDDPDETMNDLEKEAAGSDIDVDRMRSYPTGSLGGQFECGAVEMDATTSTLCAWVDQGSVAGIIVFDESPDTAASLALKVREGVEHRTS